MCCFTHFKMNKRETMYHEYGANFRLFNNVRIKSFFLIMKKLLFSVWQIIP